MTTGRILVHSSLTHFTVLASSIEKALQVGNRLTDDLSEVLDVDSSVRVLFDLQRFLSLLAGTRLLLAVSVLVEFGQQIEDRFIVDLEVGAADQEVFTAVL